MQSIEGIEIFWKMQQDSNKKSCPEMALETENPSHVKASAKEHVDGRQKNTLFSINVCQPVFSAGLPQVPERSRGKEGESRDAVICDQARPGSSLVIRASEPSAVGERGSGRAARGVRFSRHVTGGRCALCHV